MRRAKLEESLATIKELGVPIRTIIDVGVLYSTPALIDAFPSLHHVLFEPVVECYDRIKQNYQNLSYSLVEAAVSDFNGEQRLETEKKAGGKAITHSYLTKNPSDESRSVRTLTLDRYCEEHELESPYLVKIDVEGADVPTSILRGAKSTLSNTSVVLIEMTVERFYERMRLLHENGFDLWDLCNLSYYSNCLWQADAVFVKRSLKRENENLHPIHQKPFRYDLWQSGAR